MMKIAFERSIGIWGGLIDLLSGHVGYCHVEVIFSDGQWFSSVAGKGVRFATKTVRQERCFRIYNLPSITAEQEAVMRALAERMKGRKYNYLGILRFILPIKVKLSRSRDFCSETVSILFKAIGQLRHINPLTVSPNVLFLIFDERDWLKSRFYPRLCED